MTSCEPYNPLYAEELCHALQRADSILLDRGTGEVRWTKQAPALPLSLHELMLARLDELPLPQQDVLKRGAVIGELFEYDGLLQLYPSGTDKKEIAAALQHVTRAGLLTDRQQNIFYFNHPLMQEAVYNTLSFSQRQEWHTKIGNWLSERQTEQPLELIAYHYLHGNNAKKAAEFGRRAGDRAREHGIYAGALEYYEQVVALEDAPVEEKIVAVEGQADVLALQGDYSAAEQTYAQTAELGSPSARGKQAILSGNLGQLTETEFVPALQAWAEGSKACILAQNDQFEAALNSAKAALKLANDPAYDAMNSLVQLGGSLSVVTSSALLSLWSEKVHFFTP